MARRCPLCGSASTARLAAHRDFPGSSIYECRSCSLLFTFPLPEHAVLAQHYQERCVLPGAGDGSLSAKSQALAEGQYQFVIQHHPTGRVGKGARVLEVGCGPGFLLRRFAEAGADCLGIDPDAGMVEVCRAQHPDVRVVRRSFEEFCPEGELFDLILLSHVFEHFREPLTVVRRLRRMLRDGGVVFLEVPREDGAVVRMKRRRRFPYASHLFFYGDRALRAMVSAGGFSCLRLVSCGPRTEAFYGRRPPIWKRGLRRLGLLPPPPPEPAWDWNLTYPGDLMAGKNLRALLVKDSRGGA